MALSTLLLAVVGLSFLLSGCGGQTQIGFTPTAGEEADQRPQPQEQPPLDEIGAGGWARNIIQLAHNDLGKRGMNSPLALTRSGCAYVGSRNGEQGVLVLDITDPLNSRVVKEFGLHRGATSRELRVVEDLDLLVVLHYELTRTRGGTNIFEFFDISDCLDPVKIAEYDYGDLRIHEFFAWRDPNDPERLLLYVSRAPYLSVIGASRVRSVGPVEVATFDLADVGGNRRADLHSMSVSDDGTRVYMADLVAGYYTLDSTSLARGEPCDSDHTGPNPCLEKLNPDPGATFDPSPPDNPAFLRDPRGLSPDAGGHHSIVRVPGVRAGGRVFAIAADENSNPLACPWTWSRILDISETPTPEESTPLQIGAFRLPENLVENSPSPTGNS